MFRKKDTNIIEIFDPNNETLITSINCVNERSRDEIFWAILDSLNVYIGAMIRVRIEDMVQRAKDQKEKEEKDQQTQQKKPGRKPKPKPKLETSKAK